MAWFSTGLTNLKEQLNSLINDEDERLVDLESRTVLNDKEVEGNSQELNSFNVSYFPQDASVPQLEFSSAEFLHDHERRNITHYCKRLSACSLDVVALNDFLQFLVQQFMNAIDELNYLREEVDELKKINSEKPIEKNKNSFENCYKNCKISHTLASEVSSGSSICPKQSTDNFLFNKNIDDETENAIEALENSNDTELILCELADGNPRVPEFMKQSELLITAIDEARERQHLMRNNLRKMLNNCEVIDALATVLNEYFDYEEENNMMWEKLKVLFMLPVVAKFKNTKISELSVSDSIKEAFQPNCSIVMLEIPSNRRNSVILEKPETLPMPTESENEVHFSSNGADDSVRVQSKDAHLEELNRLRKHLLSVEQTYTNELLQYDEEIQLLRNQLKDSNEKLSSMTESYTSLNVHTNQTLESLQNEMKRLIEDNKNLQACYKNCQIELQKSSSETHNIRSALDLFYKNKDIEIFQATEKLRRTVEITQHENEMLRETIKHLRDNLEISEKQLKEKNISTNELKQREEEISALKNEVHKLRTESGNANLKVAEGTWNAEVTTKLNLIKNVVLRFIASDSSATRDQSLRILANVLEFSDYEKANIGLREKKDENPVFHKSLIDEFIRFVENESSPRSSETVKEKVNNKDFYNRFALHSPAIHNSTNATSSSILKDALHSDDI